VAEQVEAPVRSAVSRARTGPRTSSTARPDEPVVAVARRCEHLHVVDRLDDGARDGDPASTPA
jgi:hypothetical protein